MAYGSLWFIVMNSLCTADERKWYYIIGYYLTLFALIANAVLGFVMALTFPYTGIIWIAWILNIILLLLTKCIFLLKKRKARFTAVLFSLIILAAEGYLGYLYYLCNAIYLFIFHLVCIILIIFWNCIDVPEDVFFCFGCCIDCCKDCCEDCCDDI